MVVLIFLMCCVTWLAFRAANSAGPSICWYYIVLGTGCKVMLLYCANPLTRLWNKTFKHVPTECSTRGGDYRKMGSRSFSGRRSLSRQLRSMPSFELQVAWHSILVFRKKCLILFFHSFVLYFILQWLHPVWQHPVQHANVAAEYNPKLHQTIPTVQTGLPPASGHTKTVTTLNFIQLELWDALLFEKNKSRE